MTMIEAISCSFSLLDEKRKYNGNHRKYIIENARGVCYSSATKERIKNREAFGFYGHGRRILSGHMDPQEVDVITLPDGTKAMVSNIPSNVTTKFDIDEKGTVTHVQEILDTEPGKIVSGLNKSRVGGFSWACSGEDGAKSNATLLTGFSGFDYVLIPGFSSNRGYVLESAQGSAILESVAAVVGDDARAEQLVAGWRLSSLQHQNDMEATILELQSYCREMEASCTSLRKDLEDSKENAASLASALKKERDGFKLILESIAGEMPFFIPEDAMQAMLDGDFSRARPIFESAKTVDFSQYPLTKKKSQAARLLVPKEPEFGSAAYGFGMDL